MLRLEVYRADKFEYKGNVVLVGVTLKDEEIS